MRWWPFRRATPEPAPPLVDDGSLPVLGESRDPARSDSAVVAELTERGVDLDRPLLVRHLLLLPGHAVDEARRLTAPDGYLVSEPEGEVVGPHGRACVQVRVSRTQHVSGLSLAQERSRMAGLAQRLDGDTAGWDICGPPPAAAASDASGHQRAG